MKFYKRKKKRKFIASKNSKLELNDIGKIELKIKEHLTIQVNKKKNEICAMDWGLYATSSINSRLKKEGFRTAIVKNQKNKIFIMIVDKNKIKSFFNYCKIESLKIIKWLSK